MRPGPNHITVISGGQKQSIDLVLPDSFEPGKRVPLVIGLHPSSGNGATLDQDAGLSAAANAKGFAVMFPDGGIKLPRADGGYGHYWNIPGVPLIGGNAVPSGARDDVRFIADAIDHLVEHNCVDARRIYVTGMSGGARMSSMVGCRLADRVAAVAPVAGLRAGRAAGPDFAEPDAGDCRPSRPLAVLAVHGTDDPTNPFPGGEGLRWGYSVERAAARWASLDHCGAAPSRRAGLEARKPRALWRLRRRQRSSAVQNRSTPRSGRRTRLARRTARSSDESAGRVPAAASARRPSSRRSSSTLHRSFWSSSPVTDAALMRDARPVPDLSRWHTSTFAALLFYASKTVTTRHMLRRVTP